MLKSDLRGLNFIVSLLSLRDKCYNVAMNDNQFNDIIEVLEDISDSFESLASSLRLIVLYLWLPILVVIGIGSVFVIGLLFFMANN